VRHEIFILAPMGHAPRRQTEANLRKMAIATVDMMQGIYEWPNGKPHLDASGAPRVEFRELLRAGGYSVNYKNRGKQLFEDPYYKEQVALELARREQAFLVASARNEVSAVGLGALMVSELHTRMCHDPGSFSTEQLCKYGPQIYKIGLDIEAKKKAAEVPKKDKKSLQGIFAQQVVIMGQDQREQLSDGLQQASETRSSELQRLIAGATALRKEEELDVIDGECTEVAAE
jgi:hypothetical protein